MTQEALKLALDALETELSIDWGNPDDFDTSAEKMHEAIAAIKEALAQPEQWGASAVTHPEYVAAQKRKTEELRSMLTQPEQEPVAWHETVLNQKQFLEKMEALLVKTAAPPQPEQEPVVCCQQYDTCLRPCTPRGEQLAQRTWVGLSVFEINDLVESTEYEDYQDLVERTEAKLKEKNT